MTLYYVKTRYTNYLCSDFTEYFLIDCDHLRSVERITKEVGFDGHIEYEIKYDLDPPNNKLLVGFIDRLFFKDDKAFILDYKTTKAGFFRKTKETIKKDLQLRAYCFYVHEKFNIAMCCDFFYPRLGGVEMHIF